MGDVTVVLGGLKPRPQFFKIFNEMASFGCKNSFKPYKSPPVLKGPSVRLTSPMIDINMMVQSQKQETKRKTNQIF